MGFDTLPRFIARGEPVSPGVANRAPRTFQGNLEYLYGLLRAALAGQALFAREVPVDSTTVVGTPLYLDPATLVFRPALMAAVFDPDSGEYVPAETSELWGVVHVKHSATLADVLLSGYAPLDLSGVADDVAAGTYYLSGVEAGRLTRTRGFPSLPVLRADGQGNVLVFPQVRDVLDRHRHVHYDLTARPAGTHVPPAPGARHEITAADASLPGWLPADHESFDGGAPAGAVFGYNLAAHSALQAVWPPIPLAGAVLEIDRALADAEGFHGVPTGSAGLVVIDRRGIWWLSDCYGDVPWPTDLDTTAVPVSESASESVECPRDQTFALRLYFSRPAAATSPAFVTSLRSVDSRISVRCRGTTTPAEVGDLELALDFGESLGDDDRDGHLALKELDDDGVFHRGPVVTGLRAGGSNVQFSEGVSVTREGQEPFTSGIVTISVADDADRELRPILTRLDGVNEGADPVLYLGFPDEFQSRFVSQFEVPASAPAGAVFAYRVQLLGRAVGTLPQLTAEYALLPRPSDGLDVPVLMDPNWTALSLVTVAAISNADEAVEAESATLLVEPGSVVLIRLSRDPTDVADGYAGEVGVMRQSGILTVPA